MKETHNNSTFQLSSDAAANPCLDQLLLEINAYYKELNKKKTTLRNEITFAKKLSTPLKKFKEPFITTLNNKIAKLEQLIAEKEARLPTLPVDQTSTAYTDASAQTSTNHLDAIAKGSTSPVVEANDGEHASDEEASSDHSAQKNTPMLESHTHQHNQSFLIEGNTSLDAEENDSEQVRDKARPNFKSLRKTIPISESKNNWQEISFHDPSIPEPGITSPETTQRNTVKTPPPILRNARPHDTFPLDGWDEASLTAQATQPNNRRTPGKFRDVAQAMAQFSEKSIMFVDHSIHLNTHVKNALTNVCQQILKHRSGKVGNILKNEPLKWINAEDRTDETRTFKRFAKQLATFQHGQAIAKLATILIHKICEGQLPTLEHKQALKALSQCDKHPEQILYAWYQQHRLAMEDARTNQPDHNAFNIQDGHVPATVISHGQTMAPSVSSMDNLNTPISSGQFRTSQNASDQLRILFGTQSMQSRHDDSHKASTTL